MNGDTVTAPAWGTTAPHGTAYRYTNGRCRCPACITEATLQKTRWRVKTARQGPQRIDATTTRRQLNALHRQLTWSRIAELAGVPSAKAIGLGQRHSQVLVGTAQKIDALWHDHCAPIQPDTRRLPAEPLIRHVEARYGSINASGYARQLHAMKARGTITIWQADRWACRFGMMAHELWPEAA